MFPFNVTADQRRALFLDVITRANDIAAEPVFYATISDNCTTALVRHVDDAKGEEIPCSIDLLLNGYIPRLAYERGHMPTDAPLAVVMKRFAISARAKDAGVGPDFSQRIRVGLGQKVPDEG